MKLKLNLDQLDVDSFNTTSSENLRGTVMGEQCTCWTQCGQNTCPGCPTCNGAASCGGSCNATCNASCYGTCGEATCGASCDGYCTQYDATCNGYGTCGIWPCKDVP